MPKCHTWSGLLPKCKQNDIFDKFTVRVNGLYRDSYMRSSCPVVVQFEFEINGMLLLLMKAHQARRPRSHNFKKR
jgi:hypothetical protein